MFMFMFMFTGRYARRNLHGEDVARASICGRPLQRQFSQSYGGGLFHYQATHCARHDLQNSNLGHGWARTIQEISSHVLQKCRGRNYMLRCDVSQVV